MSFHNICYVFHVSILESCHTVYSKAPPCSLLIEIDGENQAETKQIYNSQMNNRMHQYLVIWLR